MRDLQIAPWLAAAVFAGIAAPAQGGNGGHSPTPVQWPPDTCMTIVDRARDPVVEFSYTIPFEDTQVTTDEVADSRTHQFFAVCESTGWFVFLPRWVAEADVAAAAAKGLIEADTLDADDVLETSLRWDGCWARVTNDDERRPITFDAAANVVRWDTTDVAAGVYVVEGYTHEPPKNQWRTRPGVFKLIDDGDGSHVGPAVAITTTETIVWADERATIEGCVDAGDGATLTASWATIDEPLAWTEFVGPEPVATGAFALPFSPPAAALGTTVAIRVVVEDRAGRPSVAYMLEPLVLLADPAPGGSSGSLGLMRTPGPPAETDDPTGDCVCTVAPHRSAGWLAILLVFGFVRRRQAQSPGRAPHRVRRGR